MSELPVNQVICGDCIEVMKDWPENSIDTIITDPPYGIGFMGKDWDTLDKNQFGIKGNEGENDLKVKKNFNILPSYQTTGMYDFYFRWSIEALRVAKPGCIMLIFGGTRTYHRLACAIEDAGWKIRDCLMWLYGSGFPKSLDISKAIDKEKGAKRKVVGLRTGKTAKKQTDNPMVGQFNAINPGNRGINTLEFKKHTCEITAPSTGLAKLWNGWGTALKPAWEPILVAMKPIEGTFAENAEKWGVAGLNIDASRISTNGRAARENKIIGYPNIGDENPIGNKAIGTTSQGRWPANLILDEEAAALLDEQSGESKSRAIDYNFDLSNQDNPARNFTNIKSGIYFSDSGGASRFFYTAKADRKERNTGCEKLSLKKGGGMQGTCDQTLLTGSGNIRNNLMQNNHPTVKPLSLMEYLCLLTKTPKDGIVLDCFAGSSTTALACIKTGRPYIMLEKEPDYCRISEARISALKKEIETAVPHKERRAGQKGLFEVRDKKIEVKK